MKLTHRTATAATAPRKILLGLPGDRSLAAIVLIEARLCARGLGITPGGRYDRTLTIAAAYARQEQEISDRPLQAEHVSRALIAAALD